MFFFFFFFFRKKSMPLFFFFFQAEDGIRDHCVTGVQTCALPIWWFSSDFRWESWLSWSVTGRGQADQIGAHLPKPCRGGFVVAALGGFLWFAVGEVAAGHLLKVGSGGQVN